MWLGFCCTKVVPNQAQMSAAHLVDMRLGQRLLEKSCPALQDPGMICERVTLTHGPVNHGVSGTLAHAAASCYSFSTPLSCDADGGTGHT
jgi:hypothetical protein